MDLTRIARRAKGRLVPSAWRRSAHPPADRIGALEREVADLREHVGMLDEELQDSRSQARRLGEISDLVTELLANEASRRDPEFRRIVARFLDAP